MNLHRIKIKIFEQGDGVVAPAEIVPIFHHWIRSSAFDELLIDVGDYSHVPGGPGIVLVGLQSEYSFNDSGGRRGLSYTRKLDPDTDAAESLASAIRKTVTAGLNLQNEPTLAGRIRFAADRFEITFLDRLTLPNTEVGLQRAITLAYSLLEVIDQGEAEVDPVDSDDTRRPLRFMVRLGEDLTLEKFGRRLGVTDSSEVTS